MKIKDIVNREIVNLKNCDQEPIHIPGSIQPHGFLLGVHKDDFTIQFCSENALAFTGLSHAQLLGKKISDVFGTGGQEMIQSCTSFLPGQSKVFTFSFSGKELEFNAHLSDAIVVLEAENALPPIAAEHDLFAMSRQFMGYMEEAHTLVELCTLVAQGVRKTTGYDRVMIYRFDKEYNGEVIAEDKRTDLESFLGLHYPHTDIPVQARELYIKNLLRIIVDVNYTPVPLYTEDNGTEKNLDLSYSTLRSVSPIHVQYLHNMGVGATLNISLIHKKKLWGLIACHHYSPKQLSHEVRMAARLQGHFITSQIDVRQSNEEYETARQTNLALEALISRTFELTRDSLSQIVEDPNLLALCNADGVSLLIDGKIYKGGSTPEENEIGKLTTWLTSSHGRTSFHSESILLEFPGWEAGAEKNPGICYYSLHENFANHIIWYRQETVSQVNWGGDPNKAIEKDTNGLSPRKSFELWKETVKGKSLPWLQSELKAASNFVNVLQKYLGSVYLAEEEEKQRMLNAELENINWISTHDLQEPLRKIQLLASFVLSEEESALPKETYQKIEKINLAAQRMQMLIRDILKYTKLNYGSEGLQKTDLTPIVREVLVELEDTLLSTQADIRIADLPQVNGIAFLIKQVFANLIYNSLKFSVPERKPEIKISARFGELPGFTQKFHLIEYSDNGIGFEEKYNESVFNIFARLHSAKEYPGSGIGLALCKKIMNTHKGFIKAEGRPGVGVIFSLYFPVQE